MKPLKKMELYVEAARVAKTRIETKSLADVGVSAAEVGSSGAWSSVVDAQARPPRDKGIKVEDSGDGGAKLADYLAEKRLV